MRRATWSVVGSGKYATKALLVLIRRAVPRTMGRVAKSLRVHLMILITLIHRDRAEVTALIRSEILYNIVRMKGCHSQVGLAGARSATGIGRIDPARTLLRLRNCPIFFSLLRTAHFTLSTLVRSSISSTGRLAVLRERSWGACECRHGRWVHAWSIQCSLVLRVGTCVWLLQGLLQVSVRWWEAVGSGFSKYLGISTLLPGLQGKVPT